jgi:hypothetical protein
VARKKSDVILPDAPETKEDMAKLVRQLARHVNLMLNCYRSPLMGGEPPAGWVRYDGEFNACPEWERFPAAYHLASNLLVAVGRLAAALGLAAEASQLGDLAGVLALSRTLLEDHPIRRYKNEDTTETKVAVIDDRQEPARSMVQALAKAQYALDLLIAQTESGPRDLKRLTARRTEYAMRLRQGFQNLTWEEIVKKTDEVFPKSMGLPELTIGAMRTAWARRAVKGSGHKSIGDG